MTINIDKSFQRKKFNEMKNTSIINITEVSDSERVSLTIDDSPKKKSISPIDTDLRRRKDSVDAKEIKRSGTFTHFPELNKFSDGRMEYEMQRLMGLK